VRSLKCVFGSRSFALFVGYYNYCRVHSTLKTTPAVAAGVTDHVWTVAELLSETA
jgi:hypothetical protein